MKRLVLSIAILIFALSCGKTEEAEDGIVTLTGYRQIDPVHPQHAKSMDIMDAFEKSHTNIKINWEFVSGEAYHQKFQAMTAAGTIPDIFTIYLGARTAYITDRGLVKDIKSYTEKVKTEYNENIWASQGENGEIYFVSPNLAVTHVMYVNTKLLDELGLTFPKTHEELIAQGDIIREAGYTPISFGNSADWVMNSLFFSAIVSRYGGPEWFEKAMSGEAKFSDTNFVNALQIIDELQKEKMFSPGINQLAHSLALEEFIQGKALYLIDAAWRVPVMKVAMTEDQLAATDMKVYPALPGETFPNSSAVTLGEGLGMSATLEGAKADAAWEFMYFDTGSVGSAIKMESDTINTYKLDMSKYDLDPLTEKYVAFINETPMGYVIDAKMDAEGMGVLNPAIQEMLLGNKTPQDVANEYEAWVAENDSNRKK